MAETTTGDGRVRCAWATEEPARTYHDEEWGVPVHDDARLFELLTLEGAQAGLSWNTILRKRAGYRRVFHDFDPALVARLDEEAIAAAVADPGIVRHRGKIRSTVANAAAFIAVQQTYGSFDAYLWAFVDGRPRISRYALDDDPPTTTELSDQISRDLKRRGFTFVGSTIVQSFLQACGVLDDHRTECFRAAPAPGRKRARQRE
jgi:DNA-3-methyladenine glycosylase I